MTRTKLEEIRDLACADHLRFTPNGTALELHKEIDHRYAMPTNLTVHIAGYPVQDDDLLRLNIRLSMQSPADPHGYEGFEKIIAWAWQNLLADHNGNPEAAMKEGCGVTDGTIRKDACLKWLGKQDKIPGVDINHPMWVRKRIVTNEGAPKRMWDAPEDNEEEEP